MQLSAPIYALKRRAKHLARRTDVALNKALDQIATEEGYRNWSHLVFASSQTTPAAKVLARLDPGDLVLVAARPGHGKTLFGLELASMASQLGRSGYFFTLDFHERDIAECLSFIGIEPLSAETSLVIDTSDDVCADYIIRRLRTENAHPLIVVDYLQLLDQKRSTPNLEDQIRSLQTYVKDEGAICAVISQIDRSFDLSGKTMPGVEDIRLPNPLDVSAFQKRVFLHDGNIRFHVQS